MASYLTPRQVAERWGCNPGQVRRLCSSGDLPAMRLGLTAWRISLAAVEAYEEARTSRPAAPEPPAPTPKEVTTRVTTTAAGFTLPDDYTPVFPDLWPGHVPAKKAALPSH